MIVPQSAQELTPRNLTLILQNAGYLTDGRVSRLHIHNASETSGIIGQTVRLQLEYAELADLPSSMIAKFPTVHANRQAYFRTLGMYAREVNFYQQLALSVPLNLPQCYVALHDNSTQHAFIVLEDLYPASVGNRVEGCTVDVAEQALTTIAKLHTSWWNHPNLQQLDWMQSYNQVAFETQFRKSWKGFLSHFSDWMSNDLMKLGTSLNQNLGKLSRLWQPPITLIHRDYNLDNLLFKLDGNGNKSIYVIDWQLIRQGRAVFDVATFLCWNLSSDIRRANEKHLLHLYHDTLLNAGIRGYTHEDCQSDYQLAQFECLARIIAILGSGVVEEHHLLLLLQTILERTIDALNDCDIDITVS